MRVVLDTNIMVRALIMPHGSVGPVILHFRQGQYTLLYAWSLLEELVDVLNRPRIRVKYNLSEQDIHTVVSLILLRGEAVKNPARSGTRPEPIRDCRDPKDDKFLEVAVSGEAEVIVSGDEDLLVLNPFRGIPILPPAEFLKMLETRRQ
jgi:putative PIN family toxin of toxin-antitoxin system